MQTGGTFITTGGSASGGPPSQRFKISYTFTDADQANGYAFVPCALPSPYPDTNYLIQCTLQDLNPEGGWLTVGYIGSDGAAHGNAPTTTSFTIVLLNINGTGMISGESVTMHCTTTWLG
jgi:hypothetical protein